MEAHTAAEGSDDGTRRAGVGTHTGGNAAKRARRSGSGATAGATAEGATSKDLCPHQRKRSRCKECGGAGICQHQRQRSQCKECGGASICQHQRVRSTCKECGGASICQHQRIRSLCKECHEEADTSMPAGLEELAGAAHAAG